MLEDLSHEGVIAVDTEADSFFNYHEKVCLIQITGAERDYVVDPLAGFDVAEFGNVLADPSRTKVFHDGEYDITILKRDYGFHFANLFDTRVAAAALGEKNPGLASVLKKHFDVDLDKSLQRSDWSHRPLTEKQIAYARLDTHFLIPLKERFEAELERLGRSMIVAGECHRLAGIPATVRSFNPDEFIRIKGARELDGAEKRALRELYILRDVLASQADRPPFKVMSNQLLLVLAEAQPRTIKGLSNVPGFSSRMIRKFGDDVMAALERARSSGPITALPHLPAKDGTSSLDDAEYELHERLRTWRKQRAEEEGMDSSLVLNRLLLIELALARPTTAEELSRIDALADWQRERYGEELVRLVGDFERDLASGKISIARGRRVRREV